MSDPDKPIHEGPSGEDAEAPASRPDQAAPAANVISIEQARLELLGRKRKGATPPRGLDGPIRMRRREVPAPVTLPPGEHSSVIVTDTPAARAHIDKKTVHPGEPGERHDKKVRVKTHFDPRRVPTQLSDRRAAGRLGAEMEAPPEMLGEEEVGSLWNRPSRPSDPGVTTARTSRPSLARPRPIPRNDRSAPLFVIAVMVVAAIGAVVVFLLSRGRTNEGSGYPETTGTATSASTAARPATSAPAVTALVTAPVSATATAPATATATLDAPSTGVGTTATASSAPAPGASSAAPSGPLGTKPVSSAPATKPTASAAPTAAPQTTATSILPFGKEEP